RHKKNDARALADYDEAIRLNSGLTEMAPAYLGRGNIWRDKGELDRAVSDYNAALALDLKYAPAFNNRGLVWYARKEYGPAITDFDEAIRLEPKYAMAYVNRGDA